MQLRLLNEFTVATGLKVFGFARNSEAIWERLFWVSLMLIGAYFTCSDIIATVTFFASFPTGTKMTQINNDTLDLGEPTLCVGVELNAENFSHFDLDQMMVSIKSADNLTGYIQRNTSALNVDQTNLLVRLVFATIEAEEHVIGPSKTHNGTSAHVLPYFKYPNPLLPKLAKLIANLNVSIRNLTTLLGAHLCHRIKLQIHFQEYAEDNYVNVIKDQICIPETIVWLGVTPQNSETTQLCLKVPNRFFKLKNNQDIVTISWWREMIEDSLEFSEFGSLGFNEDEVHLHSSENIMYIPFFYGITVGISLTGQYSKINRSTTPCSSQLKSRCLMGCRYSFIRRNCGCVAVFDDSNGSNLSRCGTFNFDNEASEFVAGFNLSNRLCLQIKVKYQPNPDCESRCFSPCNYKVFSYYYLQGKPVTRRGDTRVVLFADRFSFHEIKEISLMNYRQLLGLIGGTLSFYLGASFVVLIHICVFWLTAFTQIK